MRDKQLTCRNCKTTMFQFIETNGRQAFKCTCCSSKLFPKHIVLFQFGDVMKEKED